MGQALNEGVVCTPQAQQPAPAPAAAPSRPVLQPASGSSAAGSAAAGEQPPELKRRREEAMAFDEAALMGEDGVFAALAHLAPKK